MPKHVFVTIFLSCLVENLAKSFSFFKSRKTQSFQSFFVHLLVFTTHFTSLVFFCLLKASFAFSAAFQNGSYSPKGDTPATSNFLLHFQRRLVCEKYHWPLHFWWGIEGKRRLCKQLHNSCNQRKLFLQLEIIYKVGRATKVWQMSIAGVKFSRRKKTFPLDANGNSTTLRKLITVGWWEFREGGGKK